MNRATISIEVDAEDARVFSQATEQERRKLEILLALRLRELTSKPPRPLREIWDEIGAEAEANGLTPDILESLLRDE